MSAKIATGAIVALLAVARPAYAQDADARDGPAIGGDLSYSTDADKTDVVRLGANLDWHHGGADDYQGFRLERVTFRPSGLSRTTDYRLYFRMADSFRGWNYNGTVGTDGDTVLGNAAIHNDARLRQEYFVEREKVETPLGVSQGIYYTFGGAAIDLPLSDRTQVTLVGGLQEFTGSNVRTHLRANLIHVVEPSWGLSAQLRTRYFQNSEPGEYDYFSPKWYVEVLPVLQVRRFSGGWRYLAAGGLGGQRHSESEWRRSGYLNLRVTSPAVHNGWALNGDFLYNTTPTSSSEAYHYLRLNLGLSRALGSMRPPKNDQSAGR